MRKPRSRPPRAPTKPADAAAGAPLVLKFMLKLFDREDGKAADWPLIAETLLAVAFDALDQSPDDPRVLALLRRVNAGSYDRLTGGPADSIQPVRGAGNQMAGSFSATPSGPGHGELRFGSASSASGANFQHSRDEDTNRAEYLTR